MESRNFSKLYDISTITKSSQNPVRQRSLTDKPTNHPPTQTQSEQQLIKKLNKYKRQLKKQVYRLEIAQKEVEFYKIQTKSLKLQQDQFLEQIKSEDTRTISMIHTEQLKYDQLHHQLINERHQT